MHYMGRMTTDQTKSKLRLVRKKGGEKYVWIVAIDMVVRRMKSERCCVKQTYMSEMEKEVKGMGLLLAGLLSAAVALGLDDD